MDMAGMHALVPQGALDGAGLWPAYRATRDESVRARLVVQYMEFARMLAARMYGRRTYEGLEFDDYLQLARVGLLEAIDRYDPDGGAKFETFATRRINGAILNGIATYSELQEQVAARRRVEAERLDGLHGEAPRHGDAAALFAYLADLAVGLAVGFALEGTALVHDDSASSTSHPYDGLALKQMRTRLKEVLATLPDRQRKVLTWHYLEQRSFDEIGAALNVSRGRISQLHKQALDALRQQWGNRDTVDWSF